MEDTTTEMVTERKSNYWLGITTSKGPMIYSMETPLDKEDEHGWYDWWELGSRVAVAWGAGWK